jgi:hypothetical protein
MIFIFRVMRIALIKGILLLWRIYIAIIITTKNNTIIKVIVISNIRMLDINMVSRT